MDIMGKTFYKFMKVGQRERWSCNNLEIVNDCTVIQIDQAEVAKLKQSRNRKLCGPDNIAINNCNHGNHTQNVRTFTRWMED